MTTQDLYENLYGVKTARIKPLTVDVGTSATSLLKGDAGRLAYHIINLGATDLYFGFASDVSSINGIFVAKSGGYTSLDWREDGIIVTEPIWGISSAAVKIFLVGIRIAGVKK